MSKKIMFTGGIPGSSVEEIFDLLARKVGGRAGCWPDGEITPRRRGWIDAINKQVLAPAPCFEAAKNLSPATKELAAATGWKFLQIKDGVSVDLKGRLPYAEDAIDSYRIFKRKQGEGIIPAGTRFQLPIPGGHDITSISFPDVESWPVVIKAWQEALQDEYRRMLEVIPAKDLCIQIDYASETVHIGGTAAKVYPYVSEAPFKELFARYTSADYVLGHLRGLPREVRIGFHICCGTKPSYPVQKLDTIRLPVQLANAIQASSGGLIDYFHLPAMVESDEDYFAPLAELDVGEADIFLGLECNDGIEGMERRIAAAQRFRSDFGVAHYCGYYWNEAVMPELLDTLVKGADKF